ncbi:cytochrome P450 [Mycena rosella]|uniref:Cytochrome P450 n=1 Tax=Mycena rosella TaxID=1033263 RepID=A0AAD7G3V3_MYCRO|nr:cytochrome P450 [Mycena rosella]
MGPEVTKNPYHADAIRGNLTRNLGWCFPEVRDEIEHAFEDLLSLEGNEFHVRPNIMEVIARTSNRLFTGLTLCRTPEYLDLVILYTITVFMSGQIIGLLPDSSNHLISWLLDVAEGEERTTPTLALRILATNAAAIHTSSMALTAALFDLANYPEHILPMREEVENIDSFLCESQRLSIGAVVANEGFTFSDGTTIPYGSFLSVPATPINYDPDNYKHAATFDGRFSRMREQSVCQDDTSEGHHIFNRHMVSTAPDHVVFGQGHHACPGRFFAATELKAMLPHILLNYDVKAETKGVRPPDRWFEVVRFPNAWGNIMIWRRP